MADAMRAIEQMRRDRVAVAHQITQTEYALQRRLLDFSGLTADLGGPERADAALRTMMLDLQAQTSATDFAQFRRVADDGGVNGTTGVAASSIELALIATSYESLYGEGKPGRQSRDSSGGSVEIEVGDGGLGYSSSRESTSNGLHGKFKTTLKVNVCPDVAGTLTVEATSSSSLSKVGGAVGASTTVEVQVVAYVNDDAVMTDYDMHSHIDSAAYGGSSSSFVDMDTDSSTRAEGAQGTHMNRRSPKATDADVASAQSLAQMMVLMGMMQAIQTKDVWGKGKCVRIDTESMPAKRFGVKPSTEFSVVASPRSKIDGSFTGGTVKGTLKGGASLNPEGTKQIADARLAYIAPAERGKQAIVSLEARSKRGIGLEDVAFSTAADAYLMEGGAEGLHFSGPVCALDKPFVLKSGDVTQRFEPSSRTGGTYSYSGTMTGYDDKVKKYTFRVHGQGTYQVKLVDDVATSIIAQGPGTVETAYGPQSAEGTEKYTLKPLGDESCAGVAP